MASTTSHHVGPCAAIQSVVAASSYNSVVAVIPQNVVAVAISRQENFGVAIAVKLNGVFYRFEFAIGECEGCAALFEFCTLVVQVFHAQLKISLSNRVVQIGHFPLNGQTQILEALGGNRDAGTRERLTCNLKTIRQNCALGQFKPDAARIQNTGHHQRVVGQPIGLKCNQVRAGNAHLQRIAGQHLTQRCLTEGFEDFFTLLL